MEKAQRHLLGDDEARRLFLLFLPKNAAHSHEGLSSKEDSTENLLLFILGMITLLAIIAAVVVFVCFIG